jgi:hypothetical protein
MKRSILCLLLLTLLSPALAADASPLVQLDIRMVPVGPLQEADPEDWRQAGYQALFSPDKSLMALGIEDDAGYVMQIFLYQPASGRLIAASPRRRGGTAQTPDDISELNLWIWGEDGRFYVRADRPFGKDSVFGADMDGYAQIGDPPSDVAEKIAASDAARGSMSYNSDIPQEDRPPGFDDDSYNEQQGGAFTAWAQNRGHGSFDLLVARAGDSEPRLIASGGWELKDFLLDPGGARLFHNGEDGLVVTDPDTGAARRLKGTQGSSSEVRPMNLSADGEILVYWAVRSCTDETAADVGDDTGRRVCVAYLPPAEAPATPTTSASADDDPWTGRWEGAALSATIRRGTAKPDYLVIDLAVGDEECAGAVTFYGKPDGTTVTGESYALADPAAPVCRVDLSRNGDTLDAEEAGPCGYYHGASCGFDGSMTRGQ